MLLIARFPGIPLTPATGSPRTIACHLAGRSSLRGLARARVFVFRLAALTRLLVVVR